MRPHRCTIGMVLCCASCQFFQATGTAPVTPGTTLHATTLIEPSVETGQTFGYVLQADGYKRLRSEALQLLTTSDWDLIILDYSFDAGRFGKWSTKELEAIRAGKAGRKIVAYLSIGEAEDYRSYWHPIWDRDDNTIPDDGAPDFLLPVNQQWSGNYRVKYWRQPWQRIILRYLDEIVLQGFDGVYLDIVDGFQFFEYNPLNNKSVAKKMNPETQQSYRQDMVDWVVTLSAHARRAKSTFMVIPQNGSQLIEFREFFKAIDAMGIEDLFTEGNRRQPEDRIRLVTTMLAPLVDAGKPVLAVEYATGKTYQEHARTEATKHGYQLLITDRFLKNIGEDKGVKQRIQN